MRQLFLAMELITLENFASKMPAWHPGLSNHLYALVDMGRSVAANTLHGWQTTSPSR